MQYDFLKGHRVKISRIDKEDGLRPVFVHYMTGLVTSVDNLGDHEKIIIVSDAGEIGWIKILKNINSDQHHILILDWDSKEEGEPPDRFGLIDLDEHD